MKRNNWMMWLLVATMMILLTACGGGGTTSTNHTPVANAGADQTVATGATVTLDGTASDDEDNDTLTYTWTLASKPSGSSAALSSATAPKPSFTADKDGVYTVSLVVNDGTIDSTADTVKITAHDGQPPIASVLSPANGATGVSRSTQVAATFNEAMKSSTITSGSFTLTPNSGSAVSASVAYDTTNNTATLTPDANLSMLTSYQAKLASTITDLSGNALPQTTWQFTTADGSWGTEAVIETGTGDARSPQIAIDSNGNAIAVWYQHDGSHWNIYANRYTAGSGWGTAEVIETGTGDATSPQIAIDPNGNAIAVWYQYDGGHNNIYANRYTVGSGWGTEAVIETGTGNAYKPQIAIDPNGNAIAVWYQHDGSHDNIYANRYTVGSGWGTAAMIEAGTGGTYKPQIAIDPNGNAIAVWRQDDGSDWSIYANRYTAGSGWETEAVIETGTGDVSSPQVAIDPNGNAIAVWEQHDGSHWNIYANRYTAGSGWGTEVVIETGTGDAYYPQIATDPNGNAIAVWYQNDGGGDASIYANRYTVGSGWGTEAVIETGTGNANRPQIAIDPNGNAIAVWEQYDGSNFNICANRYTVGSGWGTAAVIETGTGNARSPQIAIDPNGNAIAVWEQHDGSYYSIYANRFQ